MSEIKINAQNDRMSVDSSPSDESHSHSDESSQDTAPDTATDNSSHGTAHGSTKVIVVAFLANLGITLAKFVGAAVSLIAKLKSPNLSRNDELTALAFLLLLAQKLLQQPGPC